MKISAKEPIGKIPFKNVLVGTPFFYDGVLHMRTVDCRRITTGNIANAVVLGTGVLNYFQSECQVLADPNLRVERYAT